MSSGSGSIFVPPTCSNKTLGPSCNISSSPCDMMQPCLNQGTCSLNISVPVGYQCSCKVDFSGAYCELDISSCHSFSICLYGGICNSTVNQTTCKCPAGKLGGHCQDEVDICKNITCQNHGQCVSKYGNWSCLCINTDLYSGTYCQIKSSSLRIKEIVSRSFAGVAIGCISAVIGFILIMDMLKYCFDINPVDHELQSWKEKKAYQRRQERNRRRERNRQDNSDQPVVAIRFNYIDA